MLGASDDWVKITNFSLQKVWTLQGAVLQLPWGDNTENKFQFLKKKKKVKIF